MEGRAALTPRVLALDLGIAAFVTVMQVQGTMAKVEADPTSVLRPLADLGQLGYVLLVVSGLAIAVRRRFPVTVVAVTAATSAAYYALDYPDGPGWLALFVALYTLTAYGDGRRSLLIGSGVIAGLTVTWLVAAADIEPRAAIGWVFFRIGASVMSAALGESVRSRRVIAADALARAELAERTREEEARARVDEERLRIAREVHDTVAHAIAVINVQSGVSAHLLDTRPEGTRAALEAIEKTSARALHEMRSILGVLHDDADERVPYPGLGQVEELLAASRSAGLDIELQGPSPADHPGVHLPSAVDSAAYRILQESLTNVIRHVGPTRVTVGVAYDAEGLSLRVANDGGTPSAATRPATTGRGLAGMRERCRLLGGDLDAGPVPDGFVVTARLPLVPTGGPAA